MPWPTWQHAAALTTVMLVLAVVARRSDRPKSAGVAAAATEVALVAFLYMIWRLARQLPLIQEAGAEERGRQIWRWERAWHLPSELAISNYAAAHSWFAEWMTVYYATVHVPALLGFLVWLYVRHKDVYPRWRNALAITTGFCLFIRFIRVAPPRLLPDLGFVDVSAVLHKSVYGPAGTGISDQYAAMPSIHIAWAAIVCFGILDATKSRWRWIGPVHLALTFLCVVATANHWWLDGIVAMVLLGIALLIDSGARRLAASRRSTAGTGGDLPAEGVEAGVGPRAGAEDQPNAAINAP